MYTCFNLKVNSCVIHKNGILTVICSDLVQDNKIIFKAL